MSGEQDVYIGIGSNLDNPLAQVTRATRSLTQLPDSQVVAVSSMYRSAPLGPADQPDYINAVVWLRTSLSALTVLEQCQSIEREQGRIREGERWGPRTLDLDLLLYGEKIIKSDRLVVPHPGLHERGFVLYPLYEINPRLSVPGHGSLAVLVKQCSGAGLERISTYEV